jgi:hypothetical protein
MAGFLQNLTGELAPRETGKVALDFGLTNALGRGHHRETLSGQTKAAATYSKRKCDHARTKERFAKAGITFEPIIFENQGGVEPRAAAILHRIAEAVAAVEGGAVDDCKRVMLERLALVIARRNSGFVRRSAAMMHVCTSTSRVLKRAIAETYLEDEAGFQ